MRVGTVILGMIITAGPLLARQTEPTLEQVMARVSEYVAAYGEKAAVVVATEKYSQTVQVEGVEPNRPRDLKAEFAIVRVAGGGWTGFRDVFEVNGQAVQDRKDRLVTLLTNTAGDANEVTRIANESARFNVGPITRNFNVPTAALFFFGPNDLSRFTFVRKGRKTIDAVETWEIEFRETRRPALIKTRSGKDVPIEGSLFVRPSDGTVVRTRFKMKNFADIEAAPEQQAPAQRPAGSPSSNNGGREAINRNQPLASIGVDKFESEADIEVTYAKPAGIDLWFPASMVELYQGPIKIKVTPVMARATTRAKYSDFRQFGASIRIVQ